MRFVSVLLRCASLSVLFLLFCSSFASGQQGSARPRITEPVDESRLVTLKGNTHPLARPAFDKGAAPDSLPIRRMMLLLSRSPEQQAAFDKFLEEQQTPGSPNFRHWLTPAEIGSTFGTDDADIQTITTWLQQQGFTVDRIAPGKSVIEFSGSAGQVRQAFHTAIDKYVVGGQEHWANSQDPMIPAALAPVVKGLVSLNNFPRNPLSHRFNVFSRDSNGVVTPEYTLPSSSGTYYAVAPADFATIYNTNPLLQAGTNGSGQTIAIIGRTNVNLQDVTDFRNLFALGSGNTSVVVDGPDPGIVSGDESEALLDLEWANAIAPGASVVLVTAQDTESSSGLDLAALHVIDNDMAGVISESYGACEAYLGAGGNQFYQALWQQAAAQGITVVIPTGDNGSVACDDPNVRYVAKSGVGVNGLASTAYNVAVGGTDFDDVGTQTSYWSSTNDSTTRASAKSYIPERTWNETCAASASSSNLSVCPAMPTSGTPPDSLNLWAGSGGASNCTVSTSSGSSITCQSGRAKPAWQTGPGVPNDGVRDLPDVSLFSSVGTSSNSFYVVCQADAMPGYPSCQPSSGSIYFFGAGGTSAAAPSFAAIVALAEQKAGTRLGNVNYLLYSIAAGAGASCSSGASSTSGCVFQDVVKGNISVPCAAGSPNCGQTFGTSTGVVVTSNQQPAYTAAAGYDLATGLGSVNAANLATSITSALTKFTPTSTALLLNGAVAPITATHGDPIDIAVSVDPTASSGQVSLVGSSAGIDLHSLTSGVASWSSKLFPGGNYVVSAHYAGDGKYGASDSNAISVSISPESSQTFVNLVTFDSSGFLQSFTGNSVPYGSIYLLRVDVADSGATVSPTGGISSKCSTGNASCPTGQVTVAANGAALDAGAYPLNSAGYSEDQIIQLPAGTYNLAATYAGDPSYTSSTGTAAVNISKAATTLTAGTAVAGPYEYGSPFAISAQLSTTSSGAAPSGSVTFLDNGSAAGSSVQQNYQYSSPGSSQGYAHVTYSGAYAAPSLGTHSLSGIYSGDSNYAVSQSSTFSFTVSQATTLVTSYGVVPSTTTPTIPVKLSADIFTTSQLDQPTGTITFYDNGTPIAGTVTYAGRTGSWNPSTGNYRADLSASLTATFTQIGQHTITVSYSGDDKYKPVSRSIGTLTVADKIPSSLTPIYSNLSPALKNYPATFSTNVIIPYATGMPLPTGTITFSDNGQPMDGTVTYLYPGSSSISVQMPYSFTTSGTHNISATYSGDATYASSTSTTPLALTVLDKLTTSINYLNVYSSVIGTPTSLVADVQSTATNIGPSMTGTVVFLDGDTPMTGDIQLLSEHGHLIASLPYTFTTQGTHNITVKYSGDANYEATTSKAFAIQVQGLLAVSLSSSQQQLSSTGGTGTTLAFVANNTANPIVATFTCTPDSSKASCSVDHASMSLPSWGTMVGTVTYTVPSLYASTLPAHHRPFTTPIVFAGVMLGACLTVRRKRFVASLVLLAALCLTLPSCGGGGSTSGSNPGGGGTPVHSSQTYKFTVTATNGTQTDSQVLTVTVQ